MINFEFNFIMYTEVTPANKTLIKEIIIKRPILGKRFLMLQLYINEAHRERRGNFSRIIP